MWKEIPRRWPVLFLIALTGCVTTTTRPMPKVDLSTPGWTVQQGQAVWRPPPSSSGPQHAGTEIAGDLILATRTDGSTFIQFSKTPFTFAIAESTPAGWQIEFPPQNKSYARHGKVPGRIVWFQLANALTGKPLAKGWTWNNSETNNWHLENRSSGESLEGFLTQ